MLLNVPAKALRLSHPPLVSSAHLRWHRILLHVKWRGACRCDAEGLPPPGYFPDLLSTDFARPEPRKFNELLGDAGEPDEGAQLVTAGMLPKEIAFNADCLVAAAERNLGVASQAAMSGAAAHFGSSPQQSLFFQHCCLLGLRANK